MHTVRLEFDRVRCAAVALAPRALEQIHGILASLRMAHGMAMIAAGVLLAAAAAPALAAQSASNLGAERAPGRARARPEEEAVHVAFLASGDIVHVELAVAVARKIALARDQALPADPGPGPTSRPARTRWRLVAHVLTENRTRVQARRWRPKGAALRFHYLDELPEGVASALGAMARAYTGSRGSLYACKPLLHRILPGVEKVIVMDTDVVVLDDLWGLWKEFGKFEDQQVMGLAHEQKIVPWAFNCGAPGQSLDTVGFNGGLQLLHLARMRGSARYNGFCRNLPNTSSAISKAFMMGECATAQEITQYQAANPRRPGGLEPSAPPRRRHALGASRLLRGDQDFYTAMDAVVRSEAARGGQAPRTLIRSLPCEWNLQLCSSFKWSDQKSKTRFPWIVDFYKYQNYQDGKAARTVCLADRVRLLHANCKPLKPIAHGLYAPEADRFASAQAYLLNADAHHTVSYAPQHVYMCVRVCVRV